MATEIASLFAKVSANTGDFEKGMHGVRDDLTGTQSSMSKFADFGIAAFKAVAVAVVAVGAAVGAMVTSSVLAAADMEQGVADIGAMMSLTADESDKLKQHILDLGLDPNLKVSATEAAEAVMALGTAGLSMAQIMGGASEATVLLANATGGDFGEAANIATDIMAQFNITAEQMDAAVDQVAGTTVASKFTIDDYRLALAQAGGVAGMVGVSFEDFNAVIGATSSSFAGGSDAGTSFKTFLQRLAPDTEPAKIALKELGLMAADGSAKFFDEAGNMRSMEEIAGLLQTATIGLSDAQKIQTFSTLFGTDAMRTALALAKGGTPIITKMKGEIGKVDAEELAAKRMDTLKGSWEIFLGVVDTLKISIGDKFLPIARKVVDWATDLATTYGPPVIKWVQSLTAQIEPVSKATWDWATRVIPPLMANLQKVWETTVKVWEAVKAMLAPITDAIGKFYSWKDILGTVGILMAGPVLAAVWGLISGLVAFAAPIAAIITAVAALRWAWENDFGGIQTFTNNALQKISDWFYKESGLWKGNWEDTWAYIIMRADRLIRIDLYNLIVGTWADIKFHIQQATIITRDTIVAWAEKTLQTVTNWKDRTVGYFTGIKDSIVNSVKDWTGPYIKHIEDWISLTTAHFKQWVAATVAHFNNFKEGAIEKFQAILSWWDDHIQPWITAGRDIVQGLWNGFKETWARFTDWTSSTWQSWVDRFKHYFGIASPSSLFAGFGENMMQGLQGGISSAGHLVTDAMGMIYDSISGQATRMTQSIISAADQGRAAWEAARIAIINTPAPTFQAVPGVPASQLSGNNAPAAGGIATVIPSTMTGAAQALANFGTTKIQEAFSTMENMPSLTEFVQNVAKFGTNAANAIYAATGTTNDAATQAATSTARYGVAQGDVGSLLAAVQVLIQKLSGVGLGTAFNINLAPDAGERDDIELRDLIAYLNAQYA